MYITATKAENAKADHAANAPRKFEPQGLDLSKMPIDQAKTQLRGIFGGDISVN